MKIDMKSWRENGEKRMSPLFRFDKWISCPVDINENDVDGVSLYARITT